MEFPKGKYFRTYLAYAIIALGIVLRLAVYFHNRNLFQDEADIARNIYERTFAQLTLPFSYRQYAPPLFLWALKALTSMFGYSEYIFRLVPLLAGMGSILLTYLLLLKYGVKHVIWYPLLLLSTGFIYIRYATELKQYSSDSFIALSLIYMALSVDLRTIGSARFWLLWVGVGSLAIWSSMPSVFILAGVGGYYFTDLYRTGDRKKIYALVGVIGVWLIQFLFYYEFILRAQISSYYLQTFHRAGFLILIPQNHADLLFDWDATANILELAAGETMLSLKFHILLIGIALVYALRQRVTTLLLLLIPTALLVFAACIHQYALTPRLVLFIMPILLLLIGIGFEQIFAHRYAYMICFCISVFSLYHFSAHRYFYEPIRVEPITESMDFLVQEHITAQQLYVHPLAFSAYTYYTAINPRMDRWAAIKNAKQLNYKDYYKFIQTFKGRTAVLYGPTMPGEVAEHQAWVNKYLLTQKYYAARSSRAYIYVSP
jgi:hypothetical protein